MVRTLMRVEKSGMLTRCQIPALALGVVNQVRILGGMIGLAASTIIFNIRIGTDLKDVLSPSEITELRHTLNAIPTFTPLQQAAISDAFASSFNAQLRVCMYVAAVCWVVSACTWSAKATPLLKRKEMHDAAIENPDSDEVKKALMEEFGDSWKKYASPEDLAKHEALRASQEESVHEVEGSKAHGEAL